MTRTVLAIAEKGREFIYSPKTAHRVNPTKAKRIVDILNDLRYKIDENHTWHIYTVDEYDNAYTYSDWQQFVAGKRGLREVFS